MNIIDKVDERFLVEIWKRQLVSAENLVTGCGEKVQVIYPGKENRDCGPDFTGAVIAAERGGLLVGDVELHLKAADWKSHGHGRDPRYNGLVLQVVWEGEAPAVLQNGRTVPTLSLKHCLSGSLGAVRYWTNLNIVPDEPCHDALGRLGDGELGRLLDEAGEERFRLKAGRFAAALDCEPPAQVLYRGIMAALGYTRNKEQFEELACRLPLAVLEDFCRGQPPQEQASLLRALLLNTAGLLEHDDNAPREQVRRCLGGVKPMNPSCWHLFRVRPENHPARRLTGAARLLARFGDEGLLQGVLRLVGESRSDIGRLEAGFMVGAEGRRSRGGRALIGQGRAREIAINIALPFAFAWAGASSQAGLTEQALRLYRVYPRLGGNEITRGLLKLLGSKASALVDSARRQQGLLHLDQTFCSSRRCDECPLAQRLASTQDGGAIHEFAPTPGRLEHLLQSCCCSKSLPFVFRLRCSFRPALLGCVAPNLYTNYVSSCATATFPLSLSLIESSL